MDPMLYYHLLIVEKELGHHLLRYVYYCFLDHYLQVAELHLWVLLSWVILPQGP